MLSEGLSSPSRLLSEKGSSTGFDPAQSTPIHPEYGSELSQILKCVGSGYLPEAGGHIYGFALPEGFTTADLVKARTELFPANEFNGFPEELFDGPGDELVDLNDLYRQLPRCIGTAPLQFPLGPASIASGEVPWRRREERAAVNSSHLLLFLGCSMCLPDGGADDGMFPRFGGVDSSLATRTGGGSTTA